MSSYIPFEIQELIIQRLPKKSLIRFISVCKAWKALIKSTEFVVGYSYSQTQPEHMMIKYEVGDPQLEVKFVCFVDDETFPQQKFAPTVPPLLQLHYVYDIVDSSCGLLFMNCYFREPDGSESVMVVLWNPSIRKSVAVALPTDRELLRKPDSKPSPFGYVCGFGVCPHTNDPKIVQITYIGNGNNIESISCIPNQVMVFTLSSGEWRCLSSNHLPRKSIEFEYRYPRVIGQFIYWIAYDRTVEDNPFRYLNSLIISFDLSNEEFREIIHLPDSITHYEEPEPGSLHLFRLKESLAVVEFDFHYPLEPFVVWMMGHDDPKSFTKLFAIEAPHASINWIVGFSNSGEPIFESLEANRQDSNTSCHLVICEPCSGHMKHLGLRGNKDSFFGISYTESLLLLDHDDGRIIRC